MTNPTQPLEAVFTANHLTDTGR